MGRRFDEYAKEDRGAFRRQFSTLAAVWEFVDAVGRRADERLPELYARRETLRANVETLRIVGGEPLRRAEEALWDVAGEIEYLEPWQQVRDCLTANLLDVEITTRYVHFTSRHPRRRLCRFGPGPGGFRLEFTLGGKQQLERLAKRARRIRKA